MAWSTAFALAVAAAFAWLDAEPPVLSVPVLLFAGPVADLLLELIRSRNPGLKGVVGPDELVRTPRWHRWVLPIQVAAIAIVALAVMRGGRIPYAKAFAHTWLIWSGAGAVNALVAEWEDNAPGGFLNPKK